MQNPPEACFADLAISSRASYQGSTDQMPQRHLARQAASRTSSVPAQPASSARSPPAATVSSQFEAVKAARQNAAEAAAKAAYEQAAAAAAKIAHEQAAAAAAQAAAELLLEEEQALQAAEHAKHRSSVKKARQKQRKHVGTRSSASQGVHRRVCGVDLKHASSVLFAGQQHHSCTQPYDTSPDQHYA